MVGNKWATIGNGGYSPPSHRTGPPNDGDHLRRMLLYSRKVILEPSNWLLISDHGPHSDNFQGDWWSFWANAGRKKVGCRKWEQAFTVSGCLFGGDLWDKSPCSPAHQHCLVVTGEYTSNSRPSGAGAPSERGSWWITMRGHYAVFRPGIGLTQPLTTLGDVSWSMWIGGFTELIRTHGTTLTKTDTGPKDCVSLPFLCFWFPSVLFARVVKAVDVVHGVSFQVIHASSSIRDHQLFSRVRNTDRREYSREGDRQLIWRTTRGDSHSVELDFSNGRPQLDEFPLNDVLMEGSSGGWQCTCGCAFRVV